MHDTWQVWEQYGMEDERLIAEYDTFRAAQALFNTYSEDEVEDLVVVITKNNSTEY